MKKFCLIGRGISYSLSPRIHNEIYKLYGLDAEYYVEDVAAEEIPEVLARYDGANITKPYKLEIKKHIDLSVDYSVNTVVKRDGTTIGLSTDGRGFSAALDRLSPELRGCKAKKAAVVGAGGVAYAVTEQLMLKGYDVRAYNRTACRLKNLTEVTGVKAGRRDFVPDIAIYCISGGAYVPFDAKSLKFVMDLRYGGGCVDFGGLTVHNGLYMLIYQAIFADLEFFSLKSEPKRIDEIADFIYNKLCDSKKQL